MKNYAIRSGKYLGILKVLQINTDVFKILDCDHDKMDKFSKLIDWHIERANHEAEKLEKEMMPF